MLGTSTEFDQLREFTPGDDARRMDWAATARTQRPIVRQYRAERNQSVVILLDNGRVMAGSVSASAAAPEPEQPDADTAGIATVPRVEHAMDAALALTHVATHVGDRVGLLTFDHHVRTVVPASSSRQQLGRVAEAMFLLEPSLSESAYGAAFTYATSRFRRRSLYVVLSDLAESAVEEAILPALAILARRHLVLVAAVQDPLVQRWAGGGGHEVAADTFRQAAAVALLQQRRRSSARLTAAGAVVIDSPPGRLAIDVVDRYLELKATGRL